MIPMNEAYEQANLIYTKKYELQMKYAREAIDNAILETAKDGRFSIRDFMFKDRNTSHLGPTDFKIIADEYTKAGYSVTLSGYNLNVFSISWKK